MKIQCPKITPSLEKAENIVIQQEELPSLHIDNCIFRNVMFEDCEFENIDLMDVIF